MLSRITPTTSIVTIVILYCFISVGISMSMSTSQTNSLNELSLEHQVDGVAILNTATQIAGAFGLSLYLGIMTFYQNTYLRNVNNPNNLQNKLNAIYNGFDHSMLVATIIIACGFVLSLYLRRDTKKGKIHAITYKSSFNVKCYIEQ